MRNRVRFNRILTLREQLTVWLTPTCVRGAMKIAMTISFEPDVAPRVRAAAIHRLRNTLRFNTDTLDHFTSPEALAVLTFMDTIRARIPDLVARVRKAEKSNAQMGSIAQRELEFYQSRLAICALYMRRTGYMDQDMLGEALYKAAAAIETVYPALNDDTDWPNAKLDQAASYKPS